MASSKAPILIKKKEEEEILTHKRRAGIYADRGKNMWKYNKKAAIYKPRRETLEEKNLLTP
jgi:hypothetical protein